MSTTSKQDKSFSEDLISYVLVEKSALGAAIEWIGSNLNPDQVFSDKDLEAWAESNGYTKE